MNLKLKAKSENKIFLSFLFLIILMMTALVYFEVFNEFDNTYGEELLFHEGDTLFKISKIITRAFDVPSAIILTLITASYFLYKKRKDKALFIIIAMIISALAVVLIKNLIARPRPHYINLMVRGFSFPSGHSLASSTLMTSLYLLIDFKSGRALRMGVVLLSAIAIIIALTRLILGVHYITDVVTGLMIGLFIPNLMLYVISRRLRR